MRNVTFLAAITVNIATVACLAFTTPAAPPDDKYEFRQIYKPGDRLLLAYEIGEEKKASGKVPGDMTIASKLRLSLIVSEGKKPGESIVRLEFKRVVADLKAGDFHRTVDSGNPETLPPDMPLHLLTKTSFQAVLDEAGQVVSFAGAKEFVEKWKADQADSQEKTKLQTAVEAGMIQLLREPSIYFPTRPAVVGESWTLNRKVYGLPVMGARKVHDEQVKCTLAEVKETKNGHVAVISITGEATCIEGAMPGDPKTRKKTGRVEYNLDKDMLISHHVELEGTGAILLADGNEMKFSARTTVNTLIGPDAAGKPPTGNKEK
jgi:hypothetical protein